MPNSFRRLMLSLLAVATVLAGEAHADTFEFLTYTPPRGWVKQTLPDAVAYRRPSGAGLISFYPSYPATASPPEEFAKMWRAQVEPAVPGPVPQPHLQREGEYTVAVGVRQFNAPGAVMTHSLVAFVGRGRTLGVLTTSAGDEALREVTAFLDSIKITTIAPDTPPTVAPGSAPVPASEIEVDFAVPPGYVSRREGGLVLLTPITTNEQTPCAYGVSPPRSSHGPSHAQLDADARAALLEVLPGWELKSDSYSAMRGTAGDGWPYFWFRTDVQRLVGGSYEYATAMSMAFPAGPGRVNIVWGVGNPARCLLDDLAFARLFHSLRLRGWNSDNGKALSRDLQGTWRNSQRAGIAQYKFMANGRYEFGIGTVTRMGLLERTSASVSDGRYELHGAELTITPPIVAIVVPPNIASVSTTSSSSDGGRARCLCSTRTRSRRQRCSICGSMIPADRWDVHFRPALTRLLRSEREKHETSRLNHWHASGFAVHFL